MREYISLTTLARGRGPSFHPFKGGGGGKTVTLSRVGGGAN